MKNKAHLQNKIYRKLHWFLFNKIQPEDWIHNFYPAYCHGKKYAKKHGKKITEPVGDMNRPLNVYFTEVPNEGAGIGHQISNYNGGYHFSQVFNTKFAYSPFSEKEWDDFLGFGRDEETVSELKKKGYKMLRLPFFDEEKDYVMIRNILASYEDKKVILQTELDHFYANQYQVIPHIKERFESSIERKNDKLIYSADETNIALHIRRGDINKGQVTGEKTLTKRWLDLDYYHKVMKYITEEIKPEKPLHLYLFSQGEDDYSDFEQYGKVTKCLDMSAMDSFLHMVRADILVMSKSSFSYKPALLADGIRICPDGFWHGYPDDDNWIVMKDI